MAKQLFQRPRRRFVPKSFLATFPHQNFKRWSCERARWLGMNDLRIMPELDRLDRELLERAFDALIASMERPLEESELAAFAATLHALISETDELDAYALRDLALRAA